jgi:hypothetical protein
MWYFLYRRKALLKEIIILCFHVKAAVNFKESEKDLLTFFLIIELIKPTVVKITKINSIKLQDLLFLK